MVRPIVPISKADFIPVMHLSVFWEGLVYDRTDLRVRDATGIG